MNLLDKYKYLWLVLLSLVVLIGFQAREVRLYETPRLGATFDEFAWTWLGMNIVQTGTPMSWSPHHQYENARVIKHNGAFFRLVTPYLEHPPLFGLIAGSFALMSGAENPLDVALHHIRPLALMLGTISIVLVFILANLLYGKSIGLLSALLYAVIPTITIGSRLLQNENFFIPMWLLGLIFVVLSARKRVFFIIPAIIAMLLVLSKVPFMAGGVSFFALYLFQKKYKEAFAMVGATILGIVVYVLYGMSFDKELFVSIMQLQTQRYDLTFNSIFSLFEKPYLADRFFTDGWILWGFISFILLLIKDHRKHAFLILPFLAYFGIFMAGIPDESGHGWYRYPFYPFLAIAIALFIKEYFIKNYLLTFFFIVFIGTSLLQNVYGFVFGFSFIVFRISILLWATILLPYFFDNRIFKRISHIVSYGFLIIYLLLSIISSVIFMD